MVAEFILTLALLQNPQTATLVLGPPPTRVASVEVEEAEKEYAALKAKSELTQDEARRFAALSIGLGTVPCSEADFSKTTNTERSRACRAQRAARLL